MTIKLLIYELPEDIKLRLKIDVDSRLYQQQPYIFLIYSRQEVKFFLKSKKTKRLLQESETVCFELRCGRYNVNREGYPPETSPTITSANIVWQ